MSDSTAGPRLLDIPDDWTMPKPGKRLLPAGGAVRTEQSSDTVTYHDTAAGDLADAGVSLVRGSGADGLWTLTVDGTTSRYAAAGRGVPVEIRDVLLGVRAGGALRAAGRANVERVTHHVHDADGAELGTIAEVTVSDPGETAPDRVRHVEVAGWDGPFLDAALARLRKSGAVGRTGRPDDDVDGVTGGSVGAALLGYLREQRRAVLQADLELRRGEDTVHAFRVAVRRIRSALRVVEITDPDRRGALDAELRWLSGVLGDVRDLQVLREHLAASIDGLPADTSMDRAVVGAALNALLDADEAAARATLTATLRGRRYLTLLRTLREWCDEPPLTTLADEPGKRLARYVRAAAKDLDRRLAKAGGSARKLHGARKAAKRARYVASFAGAAAGKHGAEIERRAKSLQTNLGDHQDCVLAADYVRRAATRVAGAAAFGCGVLWACEQERATTALQAATKAQQG